MVVVVEEAAQLSSSPRRLSQARTKVEAGSGHSAWQRMDELDPCQHDSLIWEPLGQTHEDSMAPTWPAKSASELPVLQASFSCVSSHAVGCNPAKQQHCPPTP